MRPNHDDSDTALYIMPHAFEKSMNEQQLRKDDAEKRSSYEEKEEQQYSSYEEDYYRYS